MKKFLNKIAWHRGFAGILALLMIISIIPIPTVQVAAETTGHPNFVTIEVKDESGNPISGAAINYKIEKKSTATNEDSFETITNTATTDTNGVVDVLDSSKYISDCLVLTASISKEGYDTNDATLAATDITSATQNYSIVLTNTSKPDIEGVKIETLNSTYIEGTQQNLITKVETDLSGVDIEYSIDSLEWSNIIPTAENAGEYPIYVKISKDGYNTYESGKLTANIEKLDISLNLTSNDLTYNESNQDLVTLKGDLKKGDILKWKVNSSPEEDGTTIPQRMAVGKYIVDLEVDRGPNYNTFTKQVQVNIKNAKLDLNGLVVKGINSIYDGSAKQAITIENQGNYDLKYQLDDGSKKPSDVAWSEKIPQVTNAGQYIVWVKAVKSNYDDANVSVTPTASNLEYPYNVYIAKAQPTLAFTNEEYNKVDLDTIDKVLKSELDAGKEYDFSAIGKESLEGRTITYSVDNENSDFDMATLEQNSGMLTVTGPGSIRIKATLSGNNNYEEKVIEHTLNVGVDDSKESTNWISFNNASIEYVVGDKTGIADNEIKYADHRDDGTVTYSIDKANELGLEISNDGTVHINHYGKLISAFGKNNTLSILVKASKEETKSKTNHVRYPKATTSYELVFKLKEISNPENSYKIFAVNDTQNQLMEPNGDDGWYNTAVSVTPVDGYKIIKEEDLLDESVQFLDGVDFGRTIDSIPRNQGAGIERAIYLQNNETGEISQRIVTSIDKIDTIKPYNLKIDFPKANEKDSKKYYGDKVTVQFTAYDDTSGVKKFHWNYTKSNDASKKNLNSDMGDVQAKLDPTDKSGTKYIANLTLPREDVEQLRGNLKISATDVAGNSSDSLTDTGVFVVDTISPTQKVTYQLKDKSKTYQTVGAKHYFSDDVEFTFKIDEANFNGEDVSVCVSKNQGEAVQQQLTWNDTTTSDEHEAKLTLSDEADYVISMNYRDRSGNEMTSYTSDTVVVDKTKPIIDFKYDDYKNSETPQTAVVTVTEHNFRKEDIKLDVIAKNIANQAVTTTDLEHYLRSCNWQDDGDVHKATISSQFADALYQIKLNYKDLALNTATEEKNAEFIVDHTAPDVNQMNITYSESLKDTILSTVSLGFYNPSVTVTFTAHDETSGIDYMTWSYKRKDGASEKNLEKYDDTKLTANQDEVDKSKFSASVTLPKEEAKQLRGTIAFYATDKYKNISDKRTDTNHVIVVDSIAPEMTAEYSQADNSQGGKDYYKHSLTATFTVTEANFFKEDVIVKMKKNDGDEVVIEPSWKDDSVDVHIGTYTIEATDDHVNDGEYVFTVQYKDRSNNEMSSYISNVKVIDTTAPVINVQYSNLSPANTITDPQGKQRQYLDATNTATITIKEQNFDEKDVDCNILATDVAGTTLNSDELCTKSKWVTNGDEHVLTIDYAKDANYTFDISYTDLAKLDAADYNPDYFTVDTAKADDLKVTYSTSVLDTVLSNISFGFYNAKTKVTISATDHISGVHSFKYSYLVAADVSKKNTQMVDAIIDSTGITYSEGGALATATFEVPKNDLSENNQFNGTVNFTATDRSDNESDYLKDTKRIVVDNIAPTATVEYNAPTQEVNGISYYDGDIKATITMDEANFYPEDVKINVLKDGASNEVTANWDLSGTDVHTGTFTLSQDGDYFVNITYVDKSGNKMADYASQQMTIDTEINQATVTINGQEGDKKAYKDEVIPAINFEDTNFESYEIKLYRTNYGNKNVDVTDKFISGHMATNANGGSGTFDTFDKVPENDGVYTLNVSFKDKANHTSEKNITFTVNRFGSVYAYSNELISLVKDGGAYVKAVDQDLVITEYNADRLTKNSLDLEISKDGKPLDHTIYTVSPEISENVTTGDSGWYQYTYTISKKNFVQDGVYKISVSSKDDTGNMPENNNYEDKNILFRVDSTPPEITSISGLEKNIINATDDDVKYTVYDTIGIKSVVVYVDGKQVNDISDFNKDPNNYAGAFDIKESTTSQKIRLLVTDLAGNVTDTDSDKFSSSYVFHKAVTVSTNMFVRWFANKTLFYGSVGGSVVVICGGAGTSMFYRKRKRIVKV